MALMMVTIVKRMWIYERAILRFLFFSLLRAACNTSTFHYVRFTHDHTSSLLLAVRLSKPMELTRTTFFDENVGASVCLLIIYNIIERKEISLGLST